MLLEPGPGALVVANGVAVDTPVGTGAVIADIPGLETSTFFSIPALAGANGFSTHVGQALRILSLCYSEAFKISRTASSST